MEIRIENLAGGALLERIQEELQRAVTNICGPNTPAKKPRKVKMEMVIKPNEQRNIAEVTVSTSSVLCSPCPLETDIYIAFDLKTGEAGASEILRGENPMQHRLDFESEPKIVRFSKE